MSIMRKTTKACIDMIKIQNNQRNWFIECVNAKMRVPEENQTTALRSRSIEYFIARMEGVNNMMECMLMEQRCYHGFKYVDENGGWVKPDYSEFMEQCREYFIK